jgi:hypothetical protein
VHDHLPRGPDLAHEGEESRAMAANFVPNVHSSIDSSNKTLLKSEALYQYVLDTTVLPHEPECMRDLRLVTDKHELYVVVARALVISYLSRLILLVDPSAVRTCVVE